MPIVKTYNGHCGDRKFLWSTVGKKVCKWLVIHFPSRKLFTRYSRKLFTRQAVSYSLGRPKTGQFILNMLFIVGRFLVSLIQCTHVHYIIYMKMNGENDRLD